MILLALCLNLLETIYNMVESKEFQTTRDYNETLTILVGQSESEAINIHGTNLASLRIPSDITGDYIHFLVSDSINGTYEVLQTNVPKTDVTDPIKFNVGINVDGGGSFAFGAADLSAWQFLKIKTVTNIAGGEAAVNQAVSNAIITLVLRPIN